MQPHAHVLPLALLVIAKAPVAGYAKTRLCPPCAPSEAAALAEAALSDTLAAVTAAPAARKVLVLDGEPGDWLPDGLEVIVQREGDLAARLAGAFADIGQPALLIGMDTPQLTTGLLTTALHLLAAPGNDAVLGSTEDGGYWTIGLRRADTRVFRDVPMSTERTGEIQLQRLNELGLRTAALPRLRDVDCFADAVAVAAQAPTTRFARTLATIAAEPGRAAA